MVYTGTEIPICKHGSLKRQCELCDKDSEIHRLERHIRFLINTGDEMASLKNCPNYMRVAWEHAKKGEI